MNKKKEILRFIHPSSLLISVAFQNFGIHFDVAGAAKNGTTLRRIEWNGRKIFAARAIDGDFDALFDSGGLGGGD